MAIAIADTEIPLWSATIVALIIVLVVAGTVSLPGSREKGLPPGPPTVPFLGNINLLPKTGIHLLFTNWAKTYGSIFSVKIGHGTMVVLTSAYHATQLLDKRSAKYSHRPPSYVVGDLVFGGDHPMFMDPDERWKLRRKLYFQLMNESRCNTEHVRLIEAESTKLLRDICLEPENVMQHPGRYTNSVISSLVCGMRTPRFDTHHYVTLGKIMTDLSALGEIGATPPIDLLPILKYVPERLMGYWRTRAANLNKLLLGLYHPLVDRLLERRQKIGSIGGTDTTSTTLLVLIQAMVTNLDVQLEAQKQIDSVVDEFTLPSWEHYDQLPLVSMIVKECLRWRPPLPGAFPHALARDDEIDGMKIPQGSTIVLNIWGMHQDASRYSHPEKYDPYRYEGQTQPASAYTNSGHEKRDHFSYGAGRRICPGIHLAERALFVATARLLWAFTMKPKVDADGKEVPIDTKPETAYKDGFLNQVRPFEVDVRVRSERRKETILAAEAKAEVDVFSTYL
ncbi:Cytochrome P450 monooxygenase [Cladobotryum mycophilum]|uniref:Cytochrome P450 monooxygenase n=1 Tax=Cladobotryum mycophilum TaxID=491253 RepID=A0ABR0SWC5_9HYPO